MRRSFAFGLAGFCVGLLTATLEAAPPANDLCIGAEVIPGAGPFPYLSSITTNINEATVLGDPPPPTNCYGGEISRSVWYQFAPAASGLYTISLKFTATTMQDTLMGIYTSPAGCVGPFTQYVCNDDIGTLQSAATTNFNAGTTYYVVVWHTLTNAPPEGQRDVQLKVTRVLPPANDHCAGAEEIPPGGPFPYWSGVANSHLATTNTDPAGTLCATSETVPQRSVWFKFRPIAGGNYIIATCTNNTATTIYNTMLAVYQNTGGCNGTNTQVRCNPGFCGTSAAVIMNLLPDTDYYIVVWDLASASDPTPLPDETDVQLFIERQGPPTVATVGHTNPAPTSVTLLGTANPKGSTTRGYFEWGPTPSYGNVTANSTLGQGIVDFPFSRVVIDLSPGSTVYYRAAAVNFFGTVFGEGKSVTLPLARPTITSVTKEGDNNLRIQFTGSEGYTHEVQGSDDLRTWTRLGDAEPLEFDQFEYIDQGAVTNRTRLFYRIKL
jgi:hypothetical protein